MSKSVDLFNSFSQPIPPVRYDLQYIPVQQDGDELLYFHDSLGYATPNFTLPSDSQSVLSLLDGQRSINQLVKHSTGEVSKNDLLHYVKYLDENGILQSKFFKDISEKVELDYEQSRFHIGNSAGTSYPDKPYGLIAHLIKAFDDYEQSQPVDARAMFAPHIDPRIGMESYVKAFSAIQHLQPKKVFIIATSHYSGMYGDLYADTPFIVTEKTFQLPNGSIEAHQNFRRMNSPKQWKNMGVTFKDRAHRVEHSIEMHVLYLNHIWKHDFEIIPILVTGMDELLYSDDSFRHKQLQAFSKFMGETYGNDEEAFFLISGDLSHFGKKFGDEEAASELLDNVDANDRLFMQAGASGNYKHLIYMMKENFDRYRICGFPPLVTFLSSFEGMEGTLHSYDLWDERDRESAVSYGSILFK